MDRLPGRGNRARISVMDRNEKSPTPGTSHIIGQRVFTSDLRKPLLIVAINPIPIERQQVSSHVKGLVLRIDSFDLDTFWARLAELEIHAPADGLGGILERVLQVSLNTSGAAMFVDGNLDRGLPMFVTNPPVGMIEAAARWALPFGTTLVLVEGVFCALRISTPRPNKLMATGTKPLRPRHMADVVTAGLIATMDDKRRARADNLLETAVGQEPPIDVKHLGVFLFSIVLVVIVEVAYMLGRIKQIFEVDPNLIPSVGNDLSPAVQNLFGIGA